MIENFNELNLSDTIAKLNELEEFVKDKELNPPLDTRYLASHESAIRDAKINTELLYAHYKKLIPFKVEIVLVDGPGVEKALEEFEELRIFAQELGFTHVASGPLVRSSYHADKQAAGEVV